MNRSDRNLPPTLFLHGGPGFGTGAERAWLGEGLGIDWWEQPRLDPGQPHGYTALLAATRDRIARLYDAHQAPMRLVASSFGCNLACEMARVVPGEIDSIVLLAPLSDARAAFGRFAAALRVTPDMSGPDESAHFWALVGQIMTVPRFTDHYWSQDAVLQQERFFDLMNDPAGFHFPTFQQVMNEFLNRRPNLTPTGYTGPVSLVVGKFDPLTCVQTEEAAMRRLFPQLRSVSLPTGHFPHLELAPEYWLASPWQQAS